MRTHLYEYHQKKGKIITFAGFDMPLCYEGIIPEHLSVRNSVGVFDVTHMGRCLIQGRNSGAFLNYLCTSEISSMRVGKGRYSLMCNERGGIVDDIVIFRLKENQFIIIYNATNRDKDFAWLNSNIRNFKVSLKEISNNTAMLALQGPNSLTTLQSIVDFDLSSLRYFWGRWVQIDGQKVFLTRTGYTGEDGFELILWDVPLSEPQKAQRLWENILATGQNYGIKTCGLGARDSLRLEAGFCLYGTDINENITPFEAALDFAVQLKKQRFIGKEALLESNAKKLKRVRVGILSLGRGIPRSGNRVWSGEKDVGYLTSGTFSPLLRSGIGMAYVSNECIQCGAQVIVKTEKTVISAEISAMPFYDETVYGRKRLRY